MHGTKDQVTEYLDKQELVIAYRRASAGGSLPDIKLPEGLIAVTLAPFNTSVATALGTGLGERIEEVAVRILRRVPRPAILNRCWSVLSAQVEAGDISISSEKEAAELLRSVLTVTVEGGNADPALQLNPRGGPGAAPRHRLHRRTRTWRRTHNRPVDLR
ncbi:hypothetical protein ACFYXP_29610 [Streptomyces sp. NPDC002466]|uniref:hypothetical protein n=1 Tax=unclassified Streptomyces TaxID=2593676 RepID=UPI0035DC056D